MNKWNSDYDGILAGIDYGLDQPVFTQIDTKHIGNKVLAAKTQKVDCTKSFSLADQLQDVAGYVKYSLKAQFAVMGVCLDQVDQKLGTPDEIVSGPLSQSATIKTLLDNAHTMMNSFHCFADWRLQYFFKLKRDATLTIPNLLKYSFGTEKYDTSSDDTCK